MDSSNLGEMLDSSQYSETNIDHYELIFGKQFVSTGGKDTLNLFTKMLQPKPNDDILDFGCGLGGSAFHLAENYDTKVFGVDISKNMIQRGLKYLQNAQPKVQQNVHLECKNVMVEDKGFSENAFDCIFTRETIVHIHDKQGLFQKFYKWLKPGGKILISDYCLGPNSGSEDFQNYIKTRNYAMINLPDYKELLEQAGFTQVILTDLTQHSIQILTSDVERLESLRNELLELMSPTEYENLLKGWKLKLHRCELGNQKWVAVLAIK